MDALFRRFDEEERGAARKSLARHISDTEHGRPGCAASGRLACCLYVSQEVNALSSPGETPSGRTAETAVLRVAYKE